MDTPTTKRADALNFLKSHNTGVLSTISAEGAARSRLVYYVPGEDFSIYFLTLVGTRKVEDIQSHPAAAFCVANDAIPQSVQIEGSVEDVSDVPVSDAIMHAIFEQLVSNAKYHAPLARFDLATVKFFRVVPTWIRWGDFTSGNHTDEVLSEIVPPKRLNSM